MVVIKEKQILKSLNKQIFLCFLDKTDGLNPRPSQYYSSDA